MADNSMEFSVSTSTGSASASAAASSAIPLADYSKSVRTYKPIQPVLKGHRRNPTQFAAPNEPEPEFSWRLHWRPVFYGFLISFLDLLAQNFFAPYLTGVAINHMSPDSFPCSGTLIAQLTASPRYAFCMNVLENAKWFIALNCLLSFTISMLLYTPLSLFGQRMGRKYLLALSYSITFFITLGILVAVENGTSYYFYFFFALFRPLIGISPLCLVYLLDSLPKKSFPSVTFYHGTFCVFVGSMAYFIGSTVLIHSAVIVSFTVACMELLVIILFFLDPNSGVNYESSNAVPHVAAAALPRLSMSVNPVYVQPPAEMQYFSLRTWQSWVKFLQFHTAAGVTVLLESWFEQVRSFRCYIWSPLHFRICLTIFLSAFIDIGFSSLYFPHFLTKGLIIDAKWAGKITLISGMIRFGSQFGIKIAREKFGLTLKWTVLGSSFILFLKILLLRYINTVDQSYGWAILFHLSSIQFPALQTFLVSNVNIEKREIAQLAVVTSLLFASGLGPVIFQSFSYGTPGDGVDFFFLSLASIAFLMNCALPPAPAKSLPSPSLPHDAQAATALSDSSVGLGEFQFPHAFSNRWQFEPTKMMSVEELIEQQEKSRHSNDNSMNLNMTRDELAGDDLSAAHQQQHRRTFSANPLQSLSLDQLGSVQNKQNQKYSYSDHSFNSNYLAAYSHNQSEQFNPLSASSANNFRSPIANSLLSGKDSIFNNPNESYNNSHLRSSMEYNQFSHDQRDSHFTRASTDNYPANPDIHDLSNNSSIYGNSQQNTHSQRDGNIQNSNYANFDAANNPTRQRQAETDTDPATQYRTASSLADISSLLELELAGDNQQQQFASRIDESDDDEFPQPPPVPKKPGSFN